ncbi:hypothetical protein OsI_22079 [Oryza sativa Indica Group]|uniref:Uncharacterized protein n=1 Tax=Oryza sativa subsp. indica TaxID=39946 RepID=A2YAG2_ORYSI|nr:hypothetical protein OsI_22079 [Oryza sativa Indica Group]
MVSRIVTTAAVAPEPSRADGVEGGGGGSRALSRGWRRGDEGGDAGGGPRALLSQMASRIATTVAAAAPEPSRHGWGRGQRWRWLPSPLLQMASRMVAPEPPVVNSVQDGVGSRALPRRMARRRWLPNPPARMVSREAAAVPEPSLADGVEDEGGDAGGVPRALPSQMASRTATTVAATAPEPSRHGWGRGQR